MSKALSLQATLCEHFLNSNATGYTETKKKRNFDLVTGFETKCCATNRDTEQDM